MRKWVLGVLLVLVVANVHSQTADGVFYHNTITFDESGLQEIVIHAPVDDYVTTIDCNAAVGLVQINITQVVGGVFYVIIFDDENITVNPNPLYYVNMTREEGHFNILIPNITEHGLMGFTSTLSPPFLGGQADTFKLVVYFIGNTTSSMGLDLRAVTMREQMACGSKLFDFPVSPTLLFLPLIATLWRKRQKIR